ncbi:MAG: 2Fe-2S iron-sulfur cluster binding domain-containing protein [Deltaproteobacteria bacterium]|nr:2Fe-2S iron-sulfur cluster binding domain-containing protein [Deltaproteobacteria bacterium]
MAKISLRVNGKSQVVDVEPDMPLLYALRNDLQLNGPKYGCGLAQCGACTVIMDGNAIRSCVTPASAAQNDPARRGHRQRHLRRRRRPAERRPVHAEAGAGGDAEEGVIARTIFGNSALAYCQVYWC